VIATRHRRVLPKPTDRLTLKRTLSVSPFCIGLVSDPRTVSAAFDAGINFFFVTADMHWPLYEGIRRGLADLLARSPSVRDRIVVAVVSYATQPEFCHAPFREVLDAIPALGHIDVTVAGGSYRKDFAVRAEQYANHGHVGARAFGTTFHERPMAGKAMREQLVDIAFIRYNALHRGAEKDVFPHVPKRRRPLLYNFKSTHGFLRADDYAALGLSSAHWQPRVTDYYRFVLARPEIDGILCAPREVREVEALARAMEEGPLTEEERVYIRDLADLAKGEARLA
jgi:aryl-alcohol dehydrogenase-like predicted oxidoreductase